MRLANTDHPCEGRHPKFDVDAGDRAKRDREEAIALARCRAPARGRQTVRFHRGVFTRSGVWFVQDLREAPRG